MEFSYTKQKYSAEQLSTLEWLDTNALGGYSSSTILHSHSRKYHGLLVSKIPSLPDKYLLLSKLDDILVVDDKKYPLTAHQYADCTLNDAFLYFQEFICDTHPQTVYQIAEDVYLAKEIMLVAGADIVLIKYKLTGVKNAKLNIKPLFAYRNFHDLTKENSFLNVTLTQLDCATVNGGRVINPPLQANDSNTACYKFTPYQGMPAFFLAATQRPLSSANPVPAPTPAPAATHAASITITPSPTWYRNFAYSTEKERGYDFTEDLFSPCSIEFSFNENGEAIIAGSLSALKSLQSAQDKCALKLKETPQEEIEKIEEADKNQDLDLFALWARELKRRKELAHKLQGSPLQKQLKKTALSFLEKNPSPAPHGRSSVVAGYHWFLEWGRDTMIALPGLTLHSGLEHECLAILKEFAVHEQAGLIPNFIGNTVENNSYNSVDASLWFAWAMQQYHMKTKDTKNIILYLWPTLKGLFNNYKNGTLYNIKMQDSGLIYAGSKETNLTWMDAVVRGQPVTPRYGLAIEINALWFNLLCFMYDLAALSSDPIKNEIAQLLPKIRLNFCQTFYAEDLGYCYDFVNENEKSKDLRPNQIFAVSLPYSPLPKKIAAKVVEKVQQHLLTPYGLRTLSPQDANYCGCHKNNQETRDYAYHNGTVWPWLLGHFGEALLKVSDRKHAAEILQPCLVALREHMYKGGIGCIAEIFSGDAPHAADGCINQAWSVAEILRLTFLLSQSEQKNSDF